MIKELRFILIILINLNYSLNISCQISSFQSGDWTQTSTWVGGVVPTRTDNVIIKSNHTVEITSGRDVRSIEIESNAILKLSNGSIVQIYPGFIATQNFVNNGTVDGPGTLKVYGYTYFSGNGIFENDIQFNIPWYMYFDSNCDLVLNNSLTVTGGGKVEIKSGSKLTLTGSSVFYTNSRMNNYGTLELQNANFCNAGLPSTTVLRNFLGSKIIYNYSGAIKMPTEGFMVGSYYSHFYDVEILNTLSSDADMKVYRSLKIDGTLTHSSSGLNVEFNGGTSGSFSGSGTANIKKLKNDQLLDLDLTCSNINIDEILYNSNSRITTNTSSNVILKSDVNSSSGMLKVGSSSEYVGNITTERYFSIDGPTNGGWINIASPIENTTMASLASATNLTLCGDFTGSNFSHAGCGNFTSLFFYDESSAAGTFSNGWKSAGSIVGYNTSNTLDIGDAPFLWAGPNANKISISGSPELDNLSVNVTKTGSSGTEDGWNLISNPYPCSIDWDAFRARNSTISTTAYAYSPSNGNWSSIVSGGSIPHSQSIFIQTNSSTSINFNLSDLSSSYNANFARSSNGINFPLVIKINGDVNSYNDKIYLNTGASFTSNFDDGFDVGKLLSPIPDYAPNIYFLDSINNKLSNNYINNNQSVSIPLAAIIGTYAHGNYTISFENLSEFMVGACLSLEDLHNGVITDLRIDSNYTFISDTNAINPRFLIHINTAYDIDVLNSNCFNDSSGSISLNGTSINGNFYKLLNSQGNLLDSIVAINNTVSFDNLLAGNYSIFTNDSNSCSLNNHNIIVSEPTQVIADFLFPSDTIYCDSSSTAEVSFSNRSVGALEFLWDFNNGNFSNNENPTQTFSSGDYVVKLTSFMDSTHICFSTINKLITIVDSSAISNLNKVSSSINYQIHDQKLFIHLDNKILSNDEKLEIFDLSGKLILSKLIPTEENEIFINLKDLRNGIYIFKLFDNSVKFYKI